MTTTFERLDFKAEGIGDTGEVRCEGVQVARAGGPGIILMHELPGMTRQCLRLAEDLYRQGFSFYLPLFFGEPGKRVRSRLRMLCIWREWSRLATGEHSPVARWVRALARRVHGECGGRGVGAIGMCLTGGYVIPLLLEHEVVAPVASQPSFPHGPDFGVSREALDAVKARCRDERLVVRGYRFRHDPIATRKKFTSFEREFGGCFVGREFPGFRHAVLTLHRREEAVAEVIRFMRTRLLQGDGEA